MKKSLFFSVLAALLMISSLPLTAGTKVGTPKVWTVPAVYTADQEVTFYYDVTDVGFPEGIDLYLWAWEPTQPDEGNGDNSSPFAKLEYLGDNIYCKTMIPTEYFNADKAAFEKEDWPGLWQQLKTKEDNLWSTEFAAPDNRTELKEFKASGAGIKFYSGSNHSYTEAFNLTQPLSVLFNADVYKIDGRTLKEIATDGDFVQFGVHSGLLGTYEGEYTTDWNPQQTLDVWRPLTLKKVGLKDLGNGIYKWDIETPATYYSYNWDNGSDPLTTPKILTLFGENPDAVIEYQCDKLAYIVVKVISNPGGYDWGINSGNQYQKAGTAEVYPDPQFSFFPQKFCAQDILTLTRKYNERTDGDLTYTITAGDKTLTGTLPGNRDKRETNINLLKELAGVTNLTKIHLKITNSHDAAVIDTDLPLVPLSEITYE